MSSSGDPLYTQAVKFISTRRGFTRHRFQEIMRVGFVKRDTLLWQLVDDGLIRHASNDRDYFLTVHLNPAPKTEDGAA